MLPGPVIGPDGPLPRLFLEGLARCHQPLRFLTAGIGALLQMGLQSSRVFPFFQILWPDILQEVAAIQLEPVVVVHGSPPLTSGWPCGWTSASLFRLSPNRRRLSRHLGASFQLRGRPHNPARSLATIPHAIGHCQVLLEARLCTTECQMPAKARLQGFHRGGPGLAQPMLRVDNVSVLREEMCPPSGWTFCPCSYLTFLEGRGRVVLRIGSPPLLPSPRRPHHLPAPYARALPTARPRGRETEKQVVRSSGIGKSKAWDLTGGN